MEQEISDTDSMMKSDTETDSDGGYIFSNWYYQYWNGSQVYIFLTFQKLPYLRRMQRESLPPTKLQGSTKYLMHILKVWDVYLYSSHIEWCIIMLFHKFLLREILKDYCSNKRSGMWLVYVKHKCNIWICNFNFFYSPKVPKTTKALKTKGSKSQKVWVIVIIICVIM